LNKGLIKIPVSAGELIDKITILEIKKKFITNKNKLRTIDGELKLLNKEFNKLSGTNRKLADKISSLKKQLYDINFKLWKTENDMRIFEAENNFEGEFVQSARNVYMLNDKRAKIKANINRLAGSKIKEIKQYGVF
jgi:predicted  nucleic acid-binding Zn-ribbon protein